MVGDVCEFRYGKSLPEIRRTGSGFGVFGSNGEVGRHKYALTAGPTIVVGRKGSFGEVAFSAEPCWPIDTTYFVDATATKADLRWLYYQLKALPLTELNRAAAIPGLNRDDAYAQRVLLPPIEEQRRIAAVLDAADALRTKRCQALTKLDTLTQAIFINMFGDPVVNPCGFPVDDLSTLGALDRGVSKHRPRNDPKLLGGSWPLVQTGDVATSGGYITAYSATYSDLGLAQSKLWPAGTLCITIAANIGKTGVLGFDACFPDSVVGFTAEDEATVEYVRHFLNFLQPALEAQAPLSAQRNINLKVLRGLRIAIPPPGLRAAFGDAVAKVRRFAAIATKGDRELDSLFASLQQRAFRGDL